MKISGCFFIVSLFVGAALTSEPAAAGPPYYQGKIIEILGESRVGGGTDTIARITATILPKHIPGKPNIVVRTMPGGAGSIANNLFYERGKPDGFHLLQNSGSPISLQLRGRDIVKYNLLDLKHIGNICRGMNVLIIRKEALPGLTDPQAEPVVIGTKEGEETWLAATLWGREFLGWNVRWIPGYSGTSDLELAFQRGEIDMMGTSNAFMIKRLVKEGEAVPLTQLGSQRKGKFIRRPDFPDVPTFVETLGEKKPTGLQWQAYISWVSTRLVDKFLCAPRGTPDEYVSILTTAYDKMGKDPRFDELIKKMVSEVYTVNVGKDTTQLLKGVLTVPAEALNYAKGLQRKYGIVK